jgi:hypothetical protein
MSHQKFELRKISYAFKHAKNRVNWKVEFDPVPINGRAGRFTWDVRIYRDSELKKLLQDTYHPPSLTNARFYLSEMESD